MRHSRFIAYTLMVTLMASVIAGALGVSIKVANADDAPAENIVSLYDIKTYIENNVDVTNNSSWVPFWSFVDTYWQNINTLITVASDSSSFNSDCIKICLMQTNSTGSYRWANDSSGNLITKGGSFNYFRTVGFLWYYGENSWGVNYQPGNYTISRFNNNITFDSNQLIFAPTRSNLQSDTVYTWCNHIVEASNNNVPLQSLNLQWDSLIPPIIEYELVLFWLGERRYLTIKDQSLIRELNGGGQMEYVLVIESPFDDLGDFELLSYQYSNLTRLQYTGVENRLENISPSGVYAIDITDLNWTEIHDSVIYDFVDPDNPELVCQCTNVPLVLQDAAPEPGTDGTPDNYTNMWQEWNTYVTNYNLTPIVPDSLSSSLFGVSGLQCYPVSVDVPEDVWVSGGNTNHDNLTIWKWWTNQTNLGINFELMDTCIISSGEFLYTLVYFHDTTLQIAFMPVQNVEITELFTMFDCVIIVPDDKGCLDKTLWYEEMIQAIGQTINLNVTFGNNIAISGTSSLGVKYLSTIPETYNDILTGYCFVTPKGIQRQQLFAFSDGVTKVYQLMVDYVESEDDWKSSFLTFTSSLFYGINTLDGSLSKILSVLESLSADINSKLDKLIENTNDVPDDSSHWYISLWNWVLQFKPSNNDFVVTLDVYDDNWNRIPLLPAPSPVPALPTIQGG